MSLAVPGGASKSRKEPQLPGMASSLGCPAVVVALDSEGPFLGEQAAASPDGTLGSRSAAA